MTLAQLIDQARHGDEQAIAQLINQSLPDLVRVKAQWQHRQLQILLETPQPLVPEEIIPTLRQGFQRLDMRRCPDLVQVYSRRLDHDFPDWIESFSLIAKDVPAITPEPDPPPEALYRSDATLIALAHIAPLWGYLFLLVDVDPGWILGPTGLFLLPWRMVAPLALLLVSGTASPLVKRQAREALNFQISWLLYWIVTLPLVFVGVGLLLAIPLALTEIICTAVAAAKASEGKEFHYPLTIRFVKE